MMTATYLILAVGLCVSTHQLASDFRGLRYQWSWWGLTIPFAALAVAIAILLNA
jgi:hypothetical protein